jgi:hypothetical protein
MNTHSLLNDRAMRVRMNRCLKKILMVDRKFVPSGVTQELRNWLLSLEMTGAERRIAENMVKEMLLEYERRLRWIGHQLEQDVFKRFGGD